MILVVRHAETEHNANRVIQVPTASLSVSGRAQAQKLAERVAGVGVTRILASDLVRAVETANCIGLRTGVVVELDPVLRERDFGDLRGVPYSELKQDPFAPEYVPPNGEGWHIFRERVAAAWLRITQAATQSTGNLVVVTHGLVCGVLVEHHLALSPGESQPVQWANTGLTEVEGTAPWLVRTMNCVAHLADER
jgi:2,3-bisphosphoglycerate-dependent phosphoglycerate mutase